MIIVHYDITVQTALEDLVKFVSGSRNVMRKGMMAGKMAGKMAAQMAEMRRAAKLEVNTNKDDENVDRGIG
jgi:ethanolamine transporter EutH